MTPRPWAEGTHEERWNGYLLHPGSDVLANKVHAATTGQLRDAENDLLEFRLVELREHPGLINPTYDLTHLQALHRHLFQDVYEWAGELRTVGLAKGGGESFMPPAEIARPVTHVAERIAVTNRLNSLSPQELPAEVAYLYDYVNFAHPFREGNGRTQREFFDQLLAESGRRLRWADVEMAHLHEACHEARNTADSGLLERLFARILMMRA